MVGGKWLPSSDVKRQISDQAHHLLLRVGLHAVSRSVMLLAISSQLGQSLSWLICSWRLWQMGVEGMDKPGGATTCGTSNHAFLLSC
jgi:hypothetical protein